MRAWAGGRVQASVRLAAAGAACVGLLSLASCVADPAPTIDVAVAGDGQATVSWEPPVGDNASVLTAYVVTPYVGSVALPSVRFDSTATTQTVTGLTNGVTYRFTVHGINALGNDTARSNLSNGVTPNGVLVAAGEHHTCARRADGSVGCWGYNEYGQLGDGTTTDSTTAVPVSGLAGAVAVATGERHSCAVLSDGTARCWGLNNLGQLGNGTTTASATPVTVSGITNAIRIDAGSWHTCAVLADGTVRCWGTNSQGQLGNGTTSPPAATPVNVTGLTNALTVTAARAYSSDLGRSHTCAVLADGTARCWGYNGSGELGNGTTTRSSFPVAVTGLTSAVAITAGTGHTCAVRADGTARCWGQNGDGELGDGTTTGSTTPVAVTGLADAASIAAGADHTCAVLGDGLARCWGANDSGQLGDGTKTSTPTPSTVTGLTDAAAITAGSVHTCAVRDDGTGRCWGSNFHGQLGNGVGSTSPPADVVALTGVTDVTAGSDHSCALLGDGTARCWGENDDGELGNGTTVLGIVGSATPVTVTGISDAAATTAGGDHSCALLADGSARCWGDNGRGQLGDGADEGLELSSSTPVPVVGVTAAVAVDAGSTHTCALLSDGTARCWGDNQWGQLGVAENGWPNTTPVPVTGLAGAVAISAGTAHTCALLADGTARCWGGNGSGELGDGTTSTSSTPVTVTGLSNAVAITAGAGYTCALIDDGTLRCWGANDWGEFGNGTTVGSTTPITVTDLSDIVAISAGSGRTCVALDDGSARCWGDSLFGGELGDGTNTGSTTPVVVGGVMGVTQISAGTRASASHSCAALGDGTASCWGTNSNGQLGDGVGSTYTTPVAVLGL